ncbi:Rrf2 family transcriptional regulator [Enterobacter hormaechei]|uniref:Rrf2 family transcriptional regulator n=1 Tax=Enterobacter hormaechei TaxID=158836 RepID=UPI002A759217|nr:Rrf2 family transcriptional regulator [Enterobacter hormaechei]MDY3570237.1 Rrf2 family transcriptional regulator [Enterobacter hormaechei]
MKALIVNDSGGVLWSYDHESQKGFTSTSYLKDGTQRKIIATLEIAHQQATGEQGSSEDTD